MRGRVGAGLKCSRRGSPCGNPPRLQPNWLVSEQMRAACLSRIVTS